MKFLFSLSLFFIFSITVNAQKLSIQTTDEQISYLNKHKVKYAKEDLYTLKDVSVFVDYLTNEKIEIPSAYFFNKDGYRVSSKYHGDRCSQVISDPEEMNKVSFDENDPVSKWLKDYMPIFTEDNSNEQYDGYVIICWAVIAKKGSNEASFNWYKSLKDNKDLKIKVILLNLDLQSTWEYTDYQKEVFGLK